MTETKQFFDYDPSIEFKKNPKVIVGDSNRIRYILSSLIKNSIQRNAESKGRNDVKVTAHISDDAKVDLTVNTNTLPHQLVMCINDYGDGNRSKIMSEISTLKRIVKAMGGSLEVNNRYDQLDFVLTVPCRKVEWVL